MPIIIFLPTIINVKYVNLYVGTSFFNIMNLVNNPIKVTKIVGYIAIYGFPPKYNIIYDNGNSNNITMHIDI